MCSSDPWVDQYANMHIMSARVRVATVSRTLPFHYLLCHKRHWAVPSLFKDIASDGCTPLPCGSSGYCGRLCTCTVLTVGAWPWPPQEGSGTGPHTAVVSRHCAAMWGRGTNFTHTCPLRPPPCACLPMWQQAASRGATPEGKV